MTTPPDGIGDRRAVAVLTGRPLPLAALGAAAISSSAVLITLSGAGAVSTAFYRSALALPVLGALAIAERRKYGRRPIAQRLKAGLAGLFLAVDLILWTHAIFDVGAGVATVLGNLQVLLVAGLAWLIWRERPGRAVLVALPVVMFGVVLVSGLVGRHAAGLHPLAGIGYGLGTSVAYAGFLMVLRSSSGGTPHVAGPVADASAATAIASGAFGLAFGGLGLHPLWPAIGWLGVLALASQTLGWLLITSSLARLPAVISSLMLLLQPAASLVLAALILGQRPTLLQLLGAALTCGGALAASLRASREPVTRSPDACPATASRPRPAQTVR